MHFYATNSRPLQLLARAEEAAGSALVPKPFRRLVFNQTRTSRVRNPALSQAGCGSGKRSIAREARITEPKELVHRHTT